MYKKLLATAIAIVGVLAFAMVGVASAHSSFNTGTNVSINQKRTNSTIFAAGNIVDINSEVFGDVICAGQTINIAGTVHGDVICAGQTVTVSGKVDGDIRLVGQSVTVSATVAGNASVAGQSFTLQSTGKIMGDATVGAANAIFNGNVGRDLTTGSEDLTIGGQVGRDIKGAVSNLRLESGAVVTGDIEFTSTNEIDLADGARVGGTVTRNDPPQQPATTKRGAVFGFSFGWFLYWFVAMLVTALVIAGFFPSMLHSVTSRAMPRPWKALLTGFVASVTVPVAMFILAVTVVGLPLSFLVGMAWFTVLLLSGPVFGYYIGRLVVPNTKHALKIMLVGASILLVLYFLPFIGFLVMLAALWIGAGMLLLELFNRTPKPKYQVPSTK